MIKFFKKTIIIASLVFFSSLSLYAAASPDIDDNSNSNVKPPEEIICKEKDGVLFCGDNQYTINGDYTVIFNATVYYENDLLLLNTEELVALFKIKVYSHEKQDFISEITKSEIELVSDNKYHLSIYFGDNEKKILSLSVVKPNENMLNLSLMSVIFNTHYANSPRVFFYIVLSAFVLLLILIEHLIDVAVGVRKVE